MADIGVASCVQSSFRSMAVPTVSTAINTVAANTVSIPLSVAANVYLLQIALRYCSKGGGYALIGESTPRVEAAQREFAARGIVAETFTWGKEYEIMLKASASADGIAYGAVLLALNKIWIDEMMAKNKTILDIDYDVDRDNPGPFYAMEREWTAAYPNKRMVYFPGSRSIKQ